MKFTAFIRAENHKSVTLFRFATVTVAFTLTILFLQGEARMKNQLTRFLKEESGQDVVEYALLLVLVAIAIAIATPSITNAILSVFSRTKSVLGV